MIEMAIVGLGSWGLCVMERTVSRARRSGTPMRLHVVEPSQLGGGVYAAEQPDFLVLNNACGQLSLYAAPTGTDSPPPPWACTSGRWPAATDGWVTSAASAPGVIPCCPPTTCPGG